MYIIGDKFSIIEIRISAFSKVFEINLLCKIRFKFFTRLFIPMPFFDLISLGVLRR